MPVEAAARRGDHLLYDRVDRAARRRWRSSLAFERDPAGAVRRPLLPDEQNGNAADDGISVAVGAGEGLALHGERRAVARAREVDHAERGRERTLTLSASAVRNRALRLARRKVSEA